MSQYVRPGGSFLYATRNVAAESITGFVDEQCEFVLAVLREQSGDFAPFWNFESAEVNLMQPDPRAVRGDGLGWLSPGLRDGTAQGGAAPDRTFVKAIKLTRNDLPMPG